MVIIIIGMAILLGWSISETMEVFKEQKPIGTKLLAIFMCILAAGLIVGFSIGVKESIRYDTLNDYFNGKIEVIEQLDTNRIYKFN